MSVHDASKIFGYRATSDTPESAAVRRTARRIRHNKRTRRELRDVRQQLRDARPLLGVQRAV